MNKTQDESTQETQPKKGDPIEIPVPSKPQIMGDFEKIATADDEGVDAAKETDR